MRYMIQRLYINICMYEVLFYQKKNKTIRSDIKSKYVYLMKGGGGIVNCSIS